MARDELETAYFTLLRAREELAALRRYDEVLQAEAQRLRRSENESAALLAQVAPKLTRPLRATDQPLRDAVEARLRVIDDERARLPERIAAAEEYVGECEREHAALRERR